ncbi:MAG: phasin family protein [Alphaproteobacteria bacterium]|nr:phasin family protein [Alphaproteobacteria bacterium]
MTTTETHAKKVASETAEKIAAAGKETLETVMKMGADATAESYKNATAFGREHLHKTRDSYSKATVYGKDNLDAMSESAAAVVAGWEAYYAGVVDYTKSAMAEHMDMVQRYFTVKTPQELMDLQVEAANLAVNRAVAQSTKMNEIAAETMTKALEPIKGRIDSTVKSFVTPRAA